MYNGLSRKEEEQKLAEIIDVAEENLERTKKHIDGLSDELKDMLETYDTRDKETLALWNNANAQLGESRTDLLRCEKARKKPYFGWIQFKDPTIKEEESYYIGRVGIAKNSADLVVIDWRAPVASLYYENVMGLAKYVVKDDGAHEIDLKHKRTYEIANDKLIDFFDSDVVATDELLTKYLAKSKKAVLGEIIATIQKEQNEIIRKSPKTNLIVQGVAGSGKTTVAMHRISYILYNYEEFKPEDFYIIGSNRILLNYITSVLPDLDVYGVSQMTMEQLFVRLLYEDWDPLNYHICPLDKKDPMAGLKGSYQWFHDLEDFCQQYEDSVISKEEIRLEKDQTLLMGPVTINTYLQSNAKESMQSKINVLNEMLMAKLENELLGKYVSLKEKEKKELEKKYCNYFGKDVWKGSIYKLYEDFLISQAKKGFVVSQKKNTFDVYDLAALAYLYRRIKETDGIREASHIIIDEAQDFGMMAYGVLKFCLRDCTYTIMGDVSQNIYYNYGLNDWEELRKLILTGTFDSFGLLRKSYRNTVEISNFATDILHHGDFSVYPVEPIIRHGNNVEIKKCTNTNQMIHSSIQMIENWQKEGHETIAVVCRDEEEAQEVSAKLSTQIELADCNLETAEFGNGVIVLPVEYTKGLEFDAVLIFHPSLQSYPADDPHVKLLYVAATRALHELAVVHLGDLTDLIAKPVSEEKRLKAFVDMEEAKVKQYTKVEYTTQELQEQDRINGQKEMEARSFGYLGPKKISVDSHLEQNYQIKKKAPVKAEGKINASLYQFGESVQDVSMLRPKGHGRIDNAIRWLKKTKSHVDLASSYGILRITPITAQIVRIQFVRGQKAEFVKGEWECQPDSSLKWTAKEGKTLALIETESLSIRIEKANGALQFMDKTGKKLLAENLSLPRQMEVSEKGILSWTYFDWEKKEALYAKGILDTQLERMNQKARYISFGGKQMRMPLLISSKGYGIGIAAENTVMCCAIPTYGPYMYTEGVKQIDYYFICGKSQSQIIENYNNLKL